MTPDGLLHAAGWYVRSIATRKAWKHLNPSIPASGEILVAVRYSRINYAETLARRGVVRTPPTPFVMGLEIVGTVVAVRAPSTAFILLVV